MTILWLHFFVLTMGLMLGKVVSLVVYPLVTVYPKLFLLYSVTESVEYHVKILRVFMVDGQG